MLEERSQQLPWVAIRLDQWLILKSSVCYRTSHRAITPFPKGSNTTASPWGRAASAVASRAEDRAVTAVNQGSGFDEGTGS